MHSRSMSWLDMRVNGVANGVDDILSNPSCIDDGLGITFGVLWLEPSEGCLACSGEAALPDAGDVIG